MLRAAGILFVAGDSALFLRRGNGSSMPNLWCVPGGKQEEGESLLECAIRETREECGQRVGASTPKLWTRTLSMASEGLADMITDPGVGPAAAQGMSGPHTAVPGDPQAYPEDVDFSTYIVKLTNQFTPNVDPDEHDGYAWAPITAPPEPLHPGVRIALERFTMNELDVAEAMAAGRLTSPQKYENVWLFAMRITGTGMSYRSGRDEYVLREPSLYTNERFLKRCNGLQVIWDHPEDGKLLGDKEFKSRTVGSIFLPYLRSDLPEDVWGIAKIYDDEAADLMSKNQMSTSPAVNFSNPLVNATVTLGGGDSLLVEGDPSIIDHLAICQNGVWDKGGDPTGIDAITTTDEVAIADAQKIASGPSSSISPLSVQLLYAQAITLSLKSRLPPKGR